MSVNNIEPSRLFGGVWEKLQDRFLLGAGAAYPAGSTGGEKTHTLTLGEMPKHAHKFGQYKRGYEHRDDGYTSVGGTPVTDDGATYNAGGGLPHNNMPPYLAVYMWKRVK